MICLYNMAKIKRVNGNAGEAGARRYIIIPKAKGREAQHRRD